MAGLPLSASDVRAIADALDPIETNEYITENWFGFRAVND